MTDDTDPVGGILLAAGQSTRYEEGNKLLADLGGKPLVRHAAETLIAAEVAGPIVVLGHQAEAVREALDSLDVDFRHNPEYRQGQSTSVAVGVAAARDRAWTAALFALGDMPRVSPASVRALVDAYREGDGTVIAPEFGGHRGNPVLFDSQHFDALADVSGDRGGRELVEEQGTLISVDDPGVRRDVDRVDDLDAVD